MGVLADCAPGLLRGFCEAGSEFRARLPGVKTKATIKQDRIALTTAPPHLAKQHRLRAAVPQEAMHNYLRQGKRYERVAVRSFHVLLAVHLVCDRTGPRIGANK